MALVVAIVGLAMLLRKRPPVPIALVAPVAAPIAPLAEPIAAPVAPIAVAPTAPPSVAGGAVAMNPQGASHRKSVVRRRTIERATVPQRPRPVIAKRLPVEVAEIALLFAIRGHRFKYHKSDEPASRLASVERHATGRPGGALEFLATTGIKTCLLSDA